MIIKHFTPYNSYAVERKMTIKDRTFFDYIELLYSYSIKRIEDDNNQYPKKNQKTPHCSLTIALLFLDSI